MTSENTNVEYIIKKIDGCKNNPEINLQQW